MSFLNPSFLWALFAMLIPVIIHLINFRRPKVMYFSNTAFIENIKKETRTKTRLKQILILLARMLTIAMLVLAFACPYIPNNQSVNNKNTDLTILYIDNSFSMDADAEKGKVFDQAKQIAKEIVYANSNAMHYIFLSNNASSNYRTTLNSDQVIDCINQTNISANTLPINDLIIKANALAKKANAANLYIISDMQKYAFNNIEAELNSNLNVTFMSLNPMKINNLYIDTCWFETPVHRLGQKELLKVKIANKSENAFYDIPLQLFLNDSLKAMTNFNVEANDAAVIEIEYSNNKAGYQAGKLQISDYPIVYDNVLYFAYSVTKQTNMLIINSNEESNYLQALFAANDEDFTLNQVKQGHEADTNIESYDFVIVNSLAEISQGLGEMLKTFINNGGSVCVFPDKQPDFASLNRFFEQFAFGTISPVESKELKLGKIDFNNNLFSGVFSKKEEQSNLPSVELMHKLNLYTNTAFSTVLATDNSLSVLVSGSYGNGKLYVFACPINGQNGEFAKSLVFAPAMYNMAVNSQMTNKLYATINQNSAIETRVTNYEAAANHSIMNEKGEEQLIDVRYNSGMLTVYLPENINEAGTYLLTQNSQAQAQIALNYNRYESMQDYLSEEELATIVENNFSNQAKILEIENYEAEKAGFKDFSEGKMLWRYFVLLAFLLIITEICLIKFMK